MAIAKGDYLTFAAIADYSGWESCEVSSGKYVRHPDITPADSHSIISRDAYLAVLYNCALTGDRQRAFRILTKMLLTGGNVGAGGEDYSDNTWDYTNVLPLLPLVLLVLLGRWVPTVPTLALGKFKTGFRAHLVVLTICLERLAGKRSVFHKIGINQVSRANPENPWFTAVRENIFGLPQSPSQQAVEESEFGWGSCPPDVYNTLLSREK